MKINIISTNINTYNQNKISFGQNSDNRINNTVSMPIQDTFILSKNDVEITQNEKLIKKRTKQLTKLGYDIDTAELLANKSEQEFQNTLLLVKNDFSDEVLLSIAPLNKSCVEKAINLSKLGISLDALQLYSKMDEESFNKSVELMKQGLPSELAAIFPNMTDEQKSVVYEILQKNADFIEAFEFVSLPEATYNIALNLLREGISPYDAVDIAKLDEEAKKHLDELFQLNVGDTNIVDFAKLNQQDYTQALDMFRKNVIPEYIPFILDIQNGKKENTEYKNYTNQGISKTSAYSLTLLDKEEKEAFDKIKEKFPELNDLIKDEYDISVINPNYCISYNLWNKIPITEVTLCKETRTRNGSLKTTVHTFNERGTHTINETEEFKDHSQTSSIVDSNVIFKTKYDKYGEMREITKIITDNDKNQITGIEHSVISPLLQNAFNTTKYNNFDLKKGVTVDNFDITTGIKNGHKGEIISSAKQNYDGSITYNENSISNGYNITRNYTIKKDLNNSILNTDYKYIIQSPEEGTILDVSRTFIRNNDNSATNTINGIEYNLTYDNKEKTVTISDGKKKRVLEFNNKLSPYSKDVLWEIIKQLQVDTLLTIDKKINMWGYCIDENSKLNKYNKSMQSGNKTDIVTHEIGHAKDTYNYTLSGNKCFIQNYNEEWDKLKQELPYNEQESIKYFDYNIEGGADGPGEFIAEANVLLTSFGFNEPIMRTRKHFLSTYFPKTIAIAADLLGLTSKKSML